MKSKHLLLTLLLALVVPWAAMAQSQLNEGFESTTFPPEDWTTIHVSGSNYWARYTTYKHSGDASAYAHWASSGHENYMITPKLAPASGESLSFYVTAQSYSGTTLYVKVSTTTAEASAFSTTLATYTTGSSGTIGTTSTSTWVEKTIDLSSYVGQQIFIAFHVVDNNGGDVIIDDVTGVTLHVASCVKPTGLAVEDGVATWDAGTASQWNLRYKKVSDETWTSVNDLNAASYTFSGLDDATSYEVQVQANCGGGDLSDWTSSVTFDNCTAITTFPWSETFENYTASSSGVTFEAPCWINEHISGNGTYLFQVYSGTNGTNATKQLKLPDMSSGTMTKLALPEMTLTTGDEYTFSIDVYRNTSGNSYTSEGVRVYASTDGEIEGATELGFLYRNCEQTDGGVVTAETNTGWYTYEFAIPFTGTCYIVLRGENQYGSATYLDNFKVKKELPCVKPSNPTFVSSTTTSATLSWTNGADTQTAWQIAYSTDPNFDPDEVTPVDVTTNPGTISGLTHSTIYYAYVRANCGSLGYSDWSVTYCQFATACDAITTFPVTYGFETSEGFPSNAAYPTTNQLGACWRNEATVQTGTNPTRVWGTSTSSIHGGSQALVLPDKGNSSNPAKTMLVFPEMNFTSANGYTVSFWIYRYGSSSNPEGFKVYVSDTDTISANAVELGHYSRNYTIAYPVVESASGWYKYEIDIPATTMTGNAYLIFEGQSYYGNATYVDDITIKEIVTVTANQIVNTVSDPATEMTWDQFAQHVSNGDRFTSSTFTLMDDITVSTMVGTSENPFTGTFEGNSKTINVNITTTETGAAPFSHIKDATIQNLTVTGTISSSANHLGGLVGFTEGGTNHIENCHVSTTLTGEAGYGLCGGIIGHGKSATNYIVGCVFDGTIDITNTDTARAIGGLLGWSDTSELHIINSVFAGTKTSNGTQRFHPMGCVDSSKTTTGEITNSYYFTDGTITDNDSYAVTKSSNLVGKGKHAYTIAGVDPVSVDFSGEHTLYNMSGIDAYAVGMKYGYSKIAGEGETVTLALDGAPGYEANHGTLVANGDVFTLTMEAYDTEISAVDCPAPYNVAANNVEATSAEISWNGNSDSYTVQYREVITAPVDENVTYDFEDGTLQGWTSYDEDGDGNGWTVASNSSYAHGGSYYAYARYNSNAVPNDWLISPQITLGGTLSFYAKKSSGTEQFQVYVSTTGTDISNFTAISDVIDATATYNKYEYDLSNYSGNGYVAIKHTGAVDQYWFYVDDITYTNTVEGEYGEWQTVSNATSPQTISDLTPETTYQVKVMGNCAGVETDYSDVIEFTTPPTCPVPTELAVTEGSVTAHEATITWTENGEATTWIVEYADNADFTDALTETVEDNATYSFDALDGETTYYVRVKAHCGEEDESGYSNVVNFTTLVACLAPTGLQIVENSITTNGASFSWDIVEGASYEYAIAEGNDVDPTTLTFAETTANPMEVNTLAPSKTYTFFLRKDCGSEDGYSEPVSVTFGTECAAITVTAANSFFEDFESPVVTTEYNSQTGLEVPRCWENPYNDNTTPQPYYQPHIIKEGTSYNYASSGQVLYFYGYGNDYVTLPEFTNPLSELAISFKYATEGSTQGTLTLGYITAEDVNYNTFTAIEGGTFDASSASDDTFVDVEPILLSSLPATATRLVFCWNYTGWYGANVDDVEVSLIQTFTKEIEAYGTSERGGYYLIASPLANNVDPTQVDGMITDELGSEATTATGTYDLYRFDQSADLEWLNYRNETFNLEPGKGYLYASKAGTTLTFTGKPYEGEGIVTLTYSDVNTSENMIGLNLVGNPFNASATPDREFYKMNNDGTRIIALGEGDEWSVGPMEGIFVYAENEGDNTMTFNLDASGKKRAGLAINLTQSATTRGGVIDRAIVRFGEGRQLPKFQLNPNHTKIYIPQSDKDYAVVSAESDMGELPVNFKAEKNGSYTLSFTNEEVTFSYLHLIDNLTGIETDLLENPSYSFDARTTDYANRFRLVFATGSSIDGDSFSFVNASGNLCIFGIEGEATVQVIDMLGHVISSETFSGSYERKINGAPGVYLVRLINGDNVKVQKVVVR